MTVDGHSGKYVELTVATDIATCAVDAGEAPLSGFWLWASPDGDRRYVQGSDETDRIYAVDVDGKRLTFFARIPHADHCRGPRRAPGDHRLDGHRAACAVRNGVVEPKPGRRAHAALTFAGSERRRGLLRLEGHLCRGTHRFVTP